jgi:hypothetical protein
MQVYTDMPGSTFKMLLALLRDDMTYILFLLWIFLFFKHRNMGPVKFIFHTRKTKCLVQQQPFCLLV